MSPRPKKASDEAVFAAAYRVMNRVGPADFTLDEIAREAGVTAAALIHRFGSKRELLVTLSAGMADTTTGFLDELRTAHRSPLAALRAYAECMAGLATSPAAYVRSLAYLQADLTDPDLRAALEQQARATRAGLESLVKAAVTAGELTPAAKPKSLARTVEAMIAGSLMTWVIYREGTTATWLRNDLDAVLKPFIR